MRFRRLCTALVTAVVLLASLLVVAPAQATSLTEADQTRVNGIGQAIIALEAYGTDNGTYVIEGAGYTGQGSGWLDKSGGNYGAVSINEALVQGYYMPSDVVGDPTNDLWMDQCLDRVAVFSLADDMAPSQSDADWWSDNNCNPYGINSLGLDFFVLSAPLPTTCNGYAPTATTINAAGEIAGTNGDDVIIGTTGNDVIRGRGGNDIICGLGGDDILYGDSGNDSLLPGGGVDEVRGGAGNDSGYATLRDLELDDLRPGGGSDWLTTEHWFAAESDVEPCFRCVRSAWRPW